MDEEIIDSTPECCWIPICKNSEVDCIYMNYKSFQPKPKCFEEQK